MRVPLRVQLAEKCFELLEEARAGGLIAREAGGLVGGLAGRTESTSMTVAAGPGLYQQLETFLSKLNPERDAQRSQEREA